MRRLTQADHFALSLYVFAYK